VAVRAHGTEPVALVVLVAVVLEPVTATRAVRGQRILVAAVAQAATACLIAPEALVVKV
jgi:hypothetical protein